MNLVTILKIPLLCKQLLPHAVPGLQGMNFNPLPAHSFTYLHTIHMVGITLLDVVRFTPRLCQWLNLGCNGHHDNSCFTYQIKPSGPLNNQHGFHCFKVLFVTLSPTSWWTQESIFPKLALPSHSHQPAICNEGTKTEEDLSPLSINPVL